MTTEERAPEYPSEATGIPMLTAPNKLFLDAVQAGIEGLKVHADILRKEGQYTADNSVGRIVREAVETKNMQADILKGWLTRVTEET